MLCGEYFRYSIFYFTVRESYLLLSLLIISWTSYGWRKSIGKWFAALPYAEGGLAYRQSHTVLLPLLSVFRPKILKSTRVTGSPSRSNFATICGIRKPQWSGYKAEKKFDDIFIRFDTIPACDIQPSSQPSVDSKDRVATRG